MKKILLAFAFVAGFSAVSFAQSSSANTDAAAAPVKVEVAGQSTSEATATDKVAAPSKSSTTKSCCSHKKGSDASCADGKKAKASRADMKEEEKPNN